MERPFISIPHDMEQKAFKSKGRRELASLPHYTIYIEIGAASIVTKALC